MSTPIDRQQQLQRSNASGTSPAAFRDANNTSRSNSSSGDTPDQQRDADALSLGPAALLVEGEDDEAEEDISILQDNIMKQSRTIDDFTRIIADWRSERENRQRGDGASVRTSFYGGDNAGASTSALGVRGLHVKGSALSLRREAENGRKSLDVDSTSQYSYEPSSIGDQDEVGVSPSASPAASVSPLAFQGEGSSKNVKVRCTCCCGRGTRRCKRARRATREWSEVESDLRLAAEIGQALLRKNDALQGEIQQNQQDYSTRLDSLMKKLSSSIREAGMLEKQREQSELNLEAADASNRSLVRELDECRREMTRLRGANTRNTGLESKVERSMREVKDLKQELQEERKKSKKLGRMHEDVSNDLRIALIEGKRQPSSSENRARRREEMKTMTESRLSTTASTAPVETAWAEDIVLENEDLQKENQQLREMLEARSEELAQMREDWNHRDNVVTSPVMGGDGERLLHPTTHTSRTFGALSSEVVEEDASQVAPNSHRSASQSPSRSAHYEVEPAPALSSPAIQSDLSHSSAASIASADTNETTVVDGEGSVKQERSTTLLAAPTTATHKTTKENRTAQLMSLIETVQRIFTRLSSADVETLSKRLQRQNLTGDVGHLARTTVNGILRDVDGLRDHFRRGMESESRNREIDNASMGSKNSNKSEKESDSLVARKEFFALIKVFRELFVEMARLRKTVNEISLQPQHAARILQEQLGLKSTEDKGMGAWIGRMFSAATPVPALSTVSSGGGISSSVTGTTIPSSHTPINANRVPSGPQLTSRASAAVLPSTVAVEVKGTHASEQQVADVVESKINSLEPPPPPHARPVLTTNQRSLSRTKSRNLSGLFVGSLSASGESDGNIDSHFNQSHARLSSEQPNNRQNRLSRIVDDDEVSIHQGYTPKLGLRPRNLSDSSIRTTYMEDESKLGALKRSSNSKAPTAISRIISPSTLSLQVSPSLLDAGVVHSSTSSTFSEDSSSTLRTTKEAPITPTPTTTAGGFLSGLAPRPVVSKALSFLSGPTAAPPLPNTSSSARLSLSAAARGSEGTTTTYNNQRQQGRAGADDILRTSQSTVRDLGF